MGGVTRFIVLTTQRTGSTWFIDTLHGHPAVTACSELLIGDVGARHPKWGGDTQVLLWEAHRRQCCQSLNLLKPLQLLRYLEQVAFARRGGERAMGFKLMYDQLARNREVMLYMIVRRVAVIHLIRQNLLDIVLSEEAVKLRQAAHAYEAVEDVRVTLDCRQLPGRLREKQRQIESARRWCQRLRLRTLEVSYEDLVRDPEGFATVLAFLGIDGDRTLPGSRLRKLNRGGRDELIANYDEVRRTLISAGFGGFLSCAVKTGH